MSLWGKNDNLVSNGTVALNGVTVTGTGTTFGTVGFGVTGNIIRFGTRGPGAGQTYFGDAVIVAIANTQSITIGSTAGLSGLPIEGGIEYHLSELPKSTVVDHSTDAGKDALPSYVTYQTAEANGFAAVGKLHIPVNFAGLGITTNTKGKDSIVNGGNNIEIVNVGFGTTVNSSIAEVGLGTVYTIAPPGAFANTSSVKVETGGVTKFVAVTSVGATSVSLASTISAQINAGTTLEFKSGNIIALRTPTTAGISTGDELLFQRFKGGYDKIVYGIGDGTSDIFSGSSTEFRTSGTGWVGVTTYLDCHGNLRVKSETLVAMGGNSQDATAGIETGSNGILYPSTN
tara:strand:- start:1095 stop:2126 length:1032 start_codon:yes stop_codon:yes gene_type:complete